MRKHKFKVGDRVRVRDWDDMVKEFGIYPANGYIRNPGPTFVDRMRKYCGKCTVVTNVYDLSVKLDIDGSVSGFYFAFETLIPLENETIVIYRKDREVIALDKATGKKGVARCNPVDTFDFTVGAKLAFSRLIGEPENTEAEKEDVIKVGDWVRVVNVGRVYPNNLPWIMENVKDPELVARFAYNDSLGFDQGVRSLPDVRFKVLVIADYKAYICRNGSSMGECYIIGLDALKKI